MSGQDLSRRQKGSADTRLGFVVVVENYLYVKVHRILYTAHYFVFGLTQATILLKIKESVV